MKLSILIPIYNFFIIDLVEELVRQCEKLKMEFEILLIDDCSLEKYHIENSKLQYKTLVKYHRLDKNIGRSKIRNLLADKANFENCLILDCDIAIVSSTFISSYIKSLDGDSVVVGGHVYDKEPPKDLAKMLHWKYGSLVECKSLKERLIKPYDSFMTNSFLVKKRMFSKIKFDETIEYYGHEDTIFGIELELNNIEIIHIDNPVRHLGLKITKDFLSCEREAIQNLIFLTKNSKFKNEIINKSKLLMYERSTLLKFYYSVLSFFYRNWLYKKLYSKNPMLSVLNFWKFNTLKEIRNSNL